MWHRVMILCIYAHVHVHVVVHAGLMSVLIMHVHVHVGSRLFVIELFCGLFLQTARM